MKEFKPGKGLTIAEKLVVMAFVFLTLMISIYFLVITLPATPAG